MRQVQESPTDYQEEYEYANPSRHCRDNVPQKTHLTEQHISKQSSVLTGRSKAPNPKPWNAARSPSSTKSHRTTFSGDER